MHLSSITLKGFKSFPERTHLEFSPGVSVIVGPNARACGVPGREAQQPAYP